MARALDRTLGMVFILPPDLPLDPGLRSEAEAIAAAHLARMRGLMPAWIEEERRLQAAADGKVQSDRVYYAVFARQLNELALWQLAPGDAAYEKATIDAIQASPAVCTNLGFDRPHDFLTRLARIQAMPAAARPAALATERRLLEAWGQPPAAIPPWPSPLPQDAGMEAVARMRAGGTRPPLALAPVLASLLLAERKGYDSLPWPNRCGFQRWWLAVSLKEGKPAAEALTAFRYGTLVGARERYGDFYEREAGVESAKPRRTDPTARPAYPKLAAYFDVTGTTRVARHFDAAGKPVKASVTERRIAVRGIRGVRPVAFEDTFDALAVGYALAGGKVAPVKPGADEEFDMVWQLDPTTAVPDARAGTEPKGAKP